MAETRTLYEAVGGSATFEALTAAFYRGVEADPALRDMYPPELEAPRKHLELFLIQYFGGPQTYIAQRGHPRLRMRHVPFAIDRAARDAWVRHMTAAVEEVGIEDPYRRDMLKYFNDAATFLMNREIPDLP
jgi:hemoglobin